MGATITPRTTTVVLFQGDDLARIDELLEAVNSAVASSGVKRVGDTDPAQDAAKAHDDFVTKATKRAVKIELKALGRKTWRELTLANPPRDKDEKDAELGFNRDTMGDALVPASIVSPEFGSNAERDAFLDSLSDGEFSKLYGAAILLNRGTGADPKADLSSRLTRISGETSD